MTVNRDPNPEHLRALLNQYAAVKLDVPLDHLSSADRSALQKLVEAASWIDRIYWKQRSGEDSSLESVLAGAHGQDTHDLERLLRLNFGPWDNFDNDRPFWGRQSRPQGGSLYPADLTREELDRYLERHPEQRPALLSRTTLIRRRDDGLVAIPYTEAYRDELMHVSAGLLAASEIVTDASFRQFLRSRAESLLSGNYRNSEELWIDAAESPIDIAIGPYEVYDDALLGLKTSYEATVIVRHPMTRHLTELQNIAHEINVRLPGAAVPADARRRLTIGVYDVVYTAGMTNMGGKAIAATLPNDAHIRSEIGARLLLFRNVIAAKFQPILKPLARCALNSAQVDLVREDAFLEHTLLHELAHALGTDFVWSGQAPTSKTVNEALSERYSTVEECRADLVGMVLLDVLTKRGVFGPDMNAAAAVTFVVNSIRSLRFGSGDSYSEGGAIAMNHLLRSGAVKAGVDGRLAVDADAVHRSISDLAGTVQNIATHGNYAAAGQLIRDLGSMPQEVENLRESFAGIPVDIEFVFNDSSRSL